MMGYGIGYGNMMGYGNFGFLQQYWGLFSFILIVELILKGFALWRAARNNQQYWFIALLVINTAGILPAVYLLMTREKKNK